MSVPLVDKIVIGHKNGRSKEKTWQMKTVTIGLIGLTDGR